GGRGSAGGSGGGGSGSAGRSGSGAGGGGGSAFGAALATFLGGSLPPRSSLGSPDGRCPPSSPSLTTSTE
ncbi:MAG: hypothetical protein FJ148_27975, partial [Deltaproteobacteria bacterium]|nr:hypothetical protein [Deltaproteobacteria bacterium]